jgi:hypothetical protein
LFSFRRLSISRRSLSNNKAGRGKKDLDGIRSCRFLRRADICIHHTETNFLGFVQHGFEIFAAIGLNC